MHCTEWMWAQWSLVCDLPLHPPSHSPQPASPKIPTITFPSHTTWPCNQHITQLSIFVHVVHTVRIWFPIAIVHFILPLPQGSETHLAKTPFPTHHTYMVIKVTELFSHTTMKCQWATDGFCQLCEPWQTLPQDHPKRVSAWNFAAICSDKDSTSHSSHEHTCTY